MENRWIGQWREGGGEIGVDEREDEDGEDGDEDNSKR